MTDRERDAALAEAIGCKVRPPNPGLSADYNCGCEDQAHWSHPRQANFVAPYFSAPTWETSGQLIEGLAARGWQVEIHSGHGGPGSFAARVWKDPSAATDWTLAYGGPKAIVLAACRATGI